MEFSPSNYLFFLHISNPREFIILLSSSLIYLYCWFLGVYSPAQVAVDNNDPEMCDFIEGEYLNEQVLFPPFG